MTITLNADYDVTLNTALLGYVGETNARPVSFEGLEIDGADRYVLTIDYGDGVEYEVDITGGQWTPTTDILRAAQTVSCQIAAKKLSGQEYILVKKSRIFRLRIGAAIGDTAIPSPDVAVDALDRIDSIGKQVTADMQTAVNAAETATTAADNAAKSATNAGVSADTATQAAGRAETAQTSAETSATQAETAKQGAETARTEAVTAQNNAKISADQASASAKQTTADKTATAGYAQTAKTAADSTAADRQAVQEMAAQVTADKATVAENTAKVAEDRTAAETAAQTAQAVADSLPDDYVTAVGKIAENTAEISAVKLTDKELQRRVNALYDMGNGVTHRFETDTDTAYAKTVPTGAKLMSVKSVGGKSVVFNQLVKTNTDFSNTITDTRTFFMLKIRTFDDNNTVKTDKILAWDSDATKLGKNSFILKITTDGKAVSISHNGEIRDIKIYHDTETQTIANHTYYISINLKSVDPTTVGGLQCNNLMLIDLTQMFGAGNEPSTVEEFEKMFPADYYTYNVGEVVSVGVTEVVEQGKNLWDEVWEKNTISYDTGLDASNPTVIRSKNYTPIIPNSTYIFVYTGSTKFGNVKVRFYDHSKNYIGGDSKSGDTYPNKLFITPSGAFYVRFTLPTEYGNVYKNDIALIAGSSGDYTPYHRNTYLIPEAVKSLPGYGWSAGTARNYIDYENKKYVQCVNSVDLGTKNWLMYKDGDYTPFFYLDSISDIRGGTSNFLCPKYQYTKIGVIGNESGLYVSENAIVRVRDTAYTDATTFKQAMQGVMLYHELATPIVTDISTMIDDDFLRNIEVEAGGSVTFKGSNDSYRIPVPSEEEYVVKLSEVGGSV